MICVVSRLPALRHHVCTSSQGGFVKQHVVLEQGYVKCLMKHYMCLQGRLKISTKDREEKKHANNRRMQ